VTGVIATLSSAFQEVLVAGCGTDGSPTGLIEAIEAQDCIGIGWLAFFEGCIATEWVGIQEAHFIWLGRRNTGKRWATSLVVKLWEITWDIWDH
jgi:hypothetical protein